MASRNVFQIIDDLAAGLAELKSALSPLAGLTGLMASPEVKKATSPRRRRTRRAPAASARPTRPAAGRERLARPTPKPAPKQSPKVDSKAKVRRKPRISETARKSYVLQAKYMHALRGLTKAQAAEVKKAKAEKGYDAAFAAAAPFKKS